MDLTAVVAALAGAQAFQTQLAVAAKIAQVGAQSDAAIVKLVDAAARSAGLPAGIGRSLDISV